MRAHWSLRICIVIVLLWSCAALPAYSQTTSGTGGSASSGDTTSSSGPSSSGGDDNNGVISTVEIVEHTMGAALSCMDWEPVGACVWMTCAAIFCTFDVTIKVKNFAPDLVMQAYNYGADEPWEDSEEINEIAQSDPDSSFVKSLISAVENFDLSDFTLNGGFTSPGHKLHHANLHHRAVDGYGNPALVAYMALADAMFGLVCAPETTPLMPYFISNLDSVSWRWGVPEILYPQGLGFGIYDLGSPTNNYGNIYPRTSMTTQQDTFKTSVLGVFRAAHIVTRGGQGHIYQEVPRDGGQGFFAPDPLTEGDDESGMFQMLYPDVESSCRSFPYGGEPSASKRDTKTQYVWNFWRAYKCCDKGGAKLIYSVG